MSSNEAMQRLCELLNAEIGAGADFELDLGELVGRYRRRHERHMQEVEADKLLPTYGPDNTAERLGVCRRTVYNLAERARKKVQATA